MKPFILSLLIVLSVTLPIRSEPLPIVSAAAAEQQARQNWERLTKDLVSRKKHRRAKEFLGKLVLFRGALIDFESGWMHVRVGSAAGAVECFVLPTQRIEAAPKSDTTIVEVLGTVMSVKPSSRKISIRSSHITIVAAQ